jgi:hypothetical protein
MDELKWSSKNMSVGQQFVAEMQDGVYYRAVVMLNGGWTKGEEVSWTDQVPKRTHLKRSTCDRMVRGSGQYVAVALARVVETWTLEETKHDPSDERLYTDWRPNFITGKAVVRTWEEHVAQQRVALKKRREDRRERRQQKALANAAAACVIEMLSPGNSGVVIQKSALGYSNASEARNIYGVSWLDDELRVSRDGLLRLASRVANSSSETEGATTDLTALLRHLQQENNALRARVETAEEKVNALRFILNQ